jgi:hypothetical protein
MKSNRQSQHSSYSTKKEELMKSPTATDIAIKFAIESERLKALAVAKEAKTLDEVILYMENLLKK